MECRLSKLNDISVTVDGIMIGGLTNVEYEILYPYNPITGPDMLDPEYTITITYRPMIGVKRQPMHNMANVTVRIAEAWRTLSFINCEVSTVICRTDSQGMVETVKFCSFEMQSSAVT